MLQPHHRLCAAAFLLDFAVGITITVMPFFIYDLLDGTETMSGTIGAITSGAYALGCLASLRFLGGMKRPMPWAAAGAFMNCSLFALSFWCRQPVLFGAVLSVGTMGNSIAWPAMHSWMGGEPNPRRRARIMGEFNIAWSAGLALGPLAGGFLYDMHLGLPFLAVGMVGAACALLILTVPHEKAHHGEATAEQLDARADHDRLGESCLHAAWIANMSAWAMVGVARMVYAKRLKDLVETGALRLFGEEQAPVYLQHHEASIFAAMSFALSFASCAAFLAMGKTAFWHHRFRYLAGLQLVCAAGLWLLGDTHSLAVMVLVYAVLGLFGGAAFFSAVYYGMSNPAKKHGRTAINETLVGLGGLLGAQSFALLALHYPMELLLHHTPWVVAGLLAAQGVALRVGKRRFL